MDENLKIVETIFQQIKMSTEFCVYMSWGIEQVKAITYDDKATLALLVNGFLHKGYIYISYDEGADTYEVRLIGDDGEVKNIVTDVYCDMLGAIIDKLVEFDPETIDEESYRKRVNEEYNIS